MSKELPEKHKPNTALQDELKEFNKELKNIPNQSKGTLIFNWDLKSVRFIHSKRSEKDEEQGESDHRRLAGKFIDSVSKTPHANPQKPFIIHSIGAILFSMVLALVCVVLITIINDRLVNAFLGFVAGVCIAVSIGLVAYVTYFSNIINGLRLTRRREEIRNLVKDNSKKFEDIGYKWLASPYYSFLILKPISIPIQKVQKKQSETETKMFEKKEKVFSREVIESPDYIVGKAPEMQVKEESIVPKMQVKQEKVPESKTKQEKPLEVKTLQKEISETNKPDKEKKQETEYAQITHYPVPSNLNKRNAGKSPLSEVQPSREYVAPLSSSRIFLNPSFLEVPDAVPKSGKENVPINLMVQYESTQLKPYNDAFDDVSIADEEHTRKSHVKKNVRVEVEKKIYDQKQKLIRIGRL